MMHRRGFTIVELLIVIVVIAILAAITIVAYNGISNRAKASAAQSAAAQVSKKVMAYAVENSDQYPADLASIGVSSSGDTTYQYSVNNTVSPRTYCITATTSNTSYYLSHSSSSPVAGGCPGHSANGVSAITNLAVNPGFESTNGSLNPNNAACVGSQGPDAHSGSRSVLLTKGNSHCYSVVMLSTANTSMAGKTYRLSAWVKSPQSSITSVYRANGGGYSPQSLSITPNTWSNVTRTFTVAATDTQTPQLDIGYENAQLPIGSTFQVDSVMITETTNTYTFADGSSPGWAWNGTPNNSTSVGVPL